MNKNKPSVFVTYSWDNEDHKARIISLTDFLRKNGFDAKNDIFLAQEETAIDFNEMIHLNISKSDKVIVVLSKGYKEKAESFQGGVGQEYKLILEDIKKNSLKYILVSIHSRSDDILPLSFKGRHVLSLEEDEKNEYQELFAKLLDENRYVFSSIGNLPEIFRKEIKPFKIEIPEEKVNLPTANSLHTGGNHELNELIKGYSKNYSSIYESGFKYIKLHKNKNFIGRVDYIKGINEFFLNNNGVNKVVIKGLAGKGKTQIALEYTFQYQNNYSVILWINAESKETIEAEYSEVYYRLGLSLDEMKIKDKVNKIKQILEGNNSYKFRWLLVLDNVLDEDIISGYIPTTGNGDVIITSQSNHWFNIDLTIDLRELPKDEAFNLLKSYTMINNEDMAIQQLSLELGYLPLALVQAGAYIRTAKTTVEKYLADFKIEKKRQYLLATSSPIGIKSLSKDYDFVISTVWEKTFSAINEKAPFVGEVLQWLAFISTSMFPIEQLRLLIEFLGDDSEGVNNADTVIGWLTNFSLITLHGDGITIHTLVQLITRDKLAVNDRHYILEKISKGLISCSRYTISSEKKYLEEMNLLIPHYYQVSSYLENERISINSFINLMYICGKFRSRENLMFKEAIETLNKSISLMEQIIDMDAVYESDINFSSSLSGIYNELAYAYEQQGEFNNSIELYKKCLNIDKKIYGDKSVKLVNRYNNLAVNYNRLGKNYDAYAYYQKCLELYEENNLDEKTILTIYNNMGSTLTALGKFEEAGKLIIQTIERAKKMYGDDYYGLANLYNNYAENLVRFDRFEEAIEYYKESLRISGNRYLDKNPHKEIVLNNIGLILIKMFKINEANAIFNEALESIFSIYGEVHPSTAKTYSNIGLAYMEVNDFKSAKDFFVKSIAIGEKVYHEPHSEMANFLNNLGWVNQELNELEEAEDSLRKSIDIKSYLFDSEEHPDFATNYINLGTVFLKKGMFINPLYYREARRYYEKGLRIDTIIYGELSVEVAIDSVNYAQLLTQVNEKNKAIEYYAKALRIYRKKFGEIHPRIGELYFYIGITYFKLKEYIETKANLENAVVVLNNYLNDTNLFEFRKHAISILKFIE